jgi:urease accessory protein
MTSKRLLPGAVLALAPTTAWAHPGQDGTGGLIDGLAHPLTGVDHLAAMLLVGLWTGLVFRGSRTMLAVPAAFLAAMLAGFATGAMFGIGLAEPLILLSLLALGTAAAIGLRAPLAIAVTAAAVFGFAHGQAHGFETPAGAFPALFAVGFLLTTGALQALGFWFARVLPARATRALGLAGAGLGLLLAGAG